MERTRSVISLGSDLALSSQCCPRECFFNSHQALRKHCKPGWNASSGLVGGAMKNMCSFLHTMTEIPYKLNKQLLFSHMTHNQLGESLVSGKLWPWATRSDNCQTQKWKTDVAEDESTGLWQPRLSLAGCKPRRPLALRMQVQLSGIVVWRWSWDWVTKITVGFIIG